MTKMEQLSGELIPPEHLIRLPRRRVVTMATGTERQSWTDTQTQNDKLKSWV